MFKKKFIYTFFILISILTSCQNDLNVEDDTTSISENGHETMSIVDYYTNGFKNAPGSILLQSQEYLTSSKSHNPNLISISESKNRKKNQHKSKNFSKIELSDGDKNTLNKASSQKEMSKLFGNNLNYKIRENYSTKEDINTSEKEAIYVPEKLKVTFSSDKILSPQTSFSWNVDPKNEEIVVYIVYDPLVQSDVNFAWDNKGRVVKMFLVQDENGSYSFSYNDLYRLPNEGTVTVHIARGNYKTIDSKGDENLSILAFTKISKDLLVQIQER
ncbi:hypothetical protein [Sinomicrobium weinanense]|uniref:Lipoprotein n=1 Tax=Sinomicrobium weinanense TaxID=2842200 RepID=A0A926JSL2_9FLAO|nr:hypothetical protein [Sinomicrobium weinanense]MBC9796755.1 hypothetical protein [Sinomicrobium weinanense]MBU3124026.1 hypothetical protein [Sinomicrobium weinanense]